MAIEAPASNVCVTCEQPATTHCAGCADVDVNGARTLTLYCGKACQNKDWSTHKKACQAAQGHKKLFKAAELIQETFYVVRAEAFDLRITKLGRDQDGKLHIFDKAAKSRGYVERAAAWTEGDIDIKHAVLSFSAGGCAYSHLLYQLGVKALKGKYPLRRLYVLEQKSNISRRLCC
jgi:endonuclease I